MKSVLIVDDDVQLCHMLREYLARRSISVVIQHAGYLGLEEVQQSCPELMLLDVMLPDISGLDLLKELRCFSDLPVLLLSARGEASDRIHGLKLGADDYLPKPFDPEELVARIDAILRRGQRGATAESALEEKLAVGALSLDVRAQIAHYNSTRLDLTEIEFRLMEMFLQRPSVVLTREELVIRVLRQPFHPLNRSLDMHVCRLRKKLETVLPLNEVIRTIRSTGYMFTEVEQAPDSG